MFVANVSQEVQDDCREVSGAFDVRQDTAMFDIHSEAIKRVQFPAIWQLVGRYLSVNAVKVVIESHLVRKARSHVIAERPQRQFNRIL